MLAKAQTEKQKGSEQGFFVRFAAGYAMPQAGMVQLDEMGIEGNSSNTSTSTNVTQKNVSFGAGPCLRLAAGYNFNRHFGAELGFHAVIPKTYDFNETIGTSYNSSRATKADGPLYVVPAFVFATGSEWKLYGRAGIGIPVSQKINQTVTANYTNQGTFAETRTEYELRFQPAFEGSLGLSHPLNPHLSLQAEISLISRSAYLKRSEMTALTVNGEDKLDDISVYGRITEYDMENVENNSFPINANEPHRELSYPVSFGSLGVNVGVTYTL